MLCQDSTIQVPVHNCNCKLVPGDEQFYTGIVMDDLEKEELFPEGVYLKGINSQSAQHQIGRQDQSYQRHIYSDVNPTSCGSLFLIIIVPNNYS